MSELREYGLQRDHVAEKLRDFREQDALSDVQALQDFDSGVAET